MKVMLEKWFVNHSICKRSLNIMIVISFIIMTSGVNLLAKTGSNAKRTKISSVSDYCSAAGAAGTTSDWIKNVTLNSINNTSDKATYSDFSAMSTNLIAGGKYTLTVKMNSHFSKDKCGAWIDFNQNNVFDPSELIDLPLIDEAGHVFESELTVPLDAVLGNTIMRVRCVYNSDMLPCDIIFGEVEDYSVVIKEPSIQYCSASGANGTGGDWIKNVSLNTLNNASEKSSYSDFSNLSTELVAGENYTLTVTLNEHYSKDKCGAWIDFDQNGVFDPSELVELPLTDATNHVYESQISVPSNASTGNTMMRVRAVYDSEPLPCDVIFGEVEDYAIVIKISTALDNTLQTSASAKLHLYPNPVKSELNIELLGFGSNPASLHIYNIKGELVFSEKSVSSNHLTVNTSSYSSGLYIIKLVTEKGINYSRFVVR